MTPEREAILLRARTARAAFFSTCALVLDLERTGYVGATAAIALIRKEYDRQLPFIDNEEAEFDKMVEELKTTPPANESPMVDDVPLV